MTKTIDCKELIILSSIFSFGIISSALPLPAFAKKSWKIYIQTILQKI